MSKSPSRTQDQFIVRLPDGMRDRIKAAAEANNRSMNAEIVATLEHAYPPLSVDVRALAALLESFRGIQPTPDDEAFVEHLNEMLARLPNGWTVKPAWDGTVTFYPYATKPPPD